MHRQGSKLVPNHNQLRSSVLLSEQIDGIVVRDVLALFLRAYQTNAASLIIARTHLSPGTKYAWLSNEIRAPRIKQS
jgi:hypothetical protein